MTPGKVYLLKARGFNWYKIGKSRKSSKRFRWLYTNLPFEVELIHAIDTDNLNSLERHFHRLFKGKRLRGEWFDLSASEVEQFKRYEGRPKSQPLPVSERLATLARLTT